MADAKSLKGYWEEFFAASTKVSELNRSLSLGGIAIIWVFNKVSLIPTKQFVSIIPPQLVWPLGIIAISLTLDLGQYLWRTITIYLFYRSATKKLQEKLITPEQADKLDAPIHIRAGGWIFFILKVICMITAYVLIIKYLMQYTQLLSC